MFLKASAKRKLIASSNSVLRELASLFAISWSNLVSLFKKSPQDYNESEAAKETEELN